MFEGDINAAAAKIEAVMQEAMGNLDRQRADTLRAFDQMRKDTLTQIAMERKAIIDGVQAIIDKALQRLGKFSIAVQEDQ